MDRVRSLIFTVGMMLAMLAVLAGYFSMEYLSEVLPADCYEDRGVYAFSPYQVLPVQVENTGAVGRERRMNPTKTVYMVYYRDTKGEGYRLEEQVLSRESGQRAVDAGLTVERRVLSIPENHTYITVEPEMTAESYSDGLRQRYRKYLGMSGIYITCYLLIWLVVLIRRNKQNKTVRGGTFS